MTSASSSGDATAPVPSGCSIRLSDHATEACALHMLPLGARFIISCTHAHHARKHGSSSTSRGWVIRMETSI